MNQQIESIGMGYAETLLEICQTLKDQGHNVSWSLCQEFMRVKRIVGNATIADVFDLSRDEDIKRLKVCIVSWRSLIVTEAQVIQFSAMEGAA